MAKGSARLRLKIALDVGIWTAAAILAFLLRIPTNWLDRGFTMPALALATVPLAFVSVVAFELYRQVWRRVTVEDLEKIAVAVGLGTACALRGRARLGPGWVRVSRAPCR